MGAGRAASGTSAEHRAALVAPDSGGSVAAIADLLGCTPRSVHRRCLAAFGYGPAVLRRVLRFRRAAALLRAGVSPAEVAAAAGYADQPHLSRETRALAGASPGQLASAANRSTPLPSGSSTTA
jgi:AraC-like DNA-binding protein